MSRPFILCSLVVDGNYRCNLSGMDLNRFWNKPNPMMHPTIFATKQLISQFTTWRRTVLYCDFHGHSTMADFALYGCDPETSCVQPREPTPSELRQETSHRWMGVVPPGEAGKERLFPTLVARNGSTLMQLSSCHYRFFFYFVSFFSLLSFLGISHVWCE
jgi:hypothetical protein